MATEEQRERAAHPNYVGVFVILGVLTVVEVAVSVLFHASPGKVPLLLFLAVGKAILVALYYMHLKFDSKIYAFFFGVGIFLLAVPFAVAMLLMNPPRFTAAAEGTEHAEPTAPAQVIQSNAPPLNVSFEGAEFHFTPNSLSAQPGQPINLTFKNVGTIEHNWTLKESGAKIVAQPGRTARGSFRAPAAGAYQFLCDIPGHAEAGMVGTLTVTE